MKYSDNAPALLITAGGSSIRYGKNKLLEKIMGKEVILHTLDAFSEIEVCEIVITVSDELKKELESLIDDEKIKLVLGGNTRQQSVFNGLKAIVSNPNMVIIHDGARPLVTKKTIVNCVEAAKEKKAVIAAVKAVDTIKKVDKNGQIIETPNRDELWCVQTPQVFDYELIFNAHKELAGDNFSDDAGLLEFLGEKVYVVESEYTNIKITTPADLDTLKTIIMNK